MMTSENLKGKLIVFEGTDGSFKETNSKKLAHYIHENITKKVMRLSYPDYDTASSYFVKKYLKGEYGKLNELDPYTVSLFYMVDRIDSRDKIKMLLDNDYCIILDRYAGSNIIYQSAKFDDEDEKTKFINWCLEMEFIRNNLASPDITIYMDLPTELKDMHKLSNRDKGGVKNDIHESNLKFQKNVDKNGLEIAELLLWNIVNCNEGDRILNENEIFSSIVNVLNNNLI